jgi:hypothetical protein
VDGDNEIGYSSRIIDLILDNKVKLPREINNK